MNKKAVLWGILDLIFLVVFNTVFFVVGGTDHVASVWIAYGFIHFAYVMLLITPFLMRKSSRATVLGLPIYLICSVYFLVALVVGIVFVLLKAESYKASLLFQVVIAGVYGVLLVVTLLANEHTQAAVQRHEAEVSYIKAAASRVKALIGKLDNKKANKTLEKAYDILHSSPVRTTPEVAEMESNILRLIADLEEAVLANNETDVITIARGIVIMAEDRISKLKQLQ